MRIPFGTLRSPVVIASLIAVTWLVVAVGLYGLRYWSGHDESVYVAKALGGPAPFNWGHHRSLGIPALLSPATILGFGPTASRTSIVVFNAAIVATGLWLWIRVYGRWVVIGPTAVLLSWLGLNNATAILPNLPAAAALFATLPALWLALTEPTRFRQAGTIAGFGVVGLLRPTAVFWVAVGIAVALLDPEVRTHFRQLVVLLAVALPLALLTWVVESFVTFGVTPLERLRRAGSAIVSYEHDSVVVTLLRNVAHPAGSDSMNLVLLSLSLGASSVLVALAFVSVKPAVRGALTITVCVGVSKLVAYVLFPSDGSARFLLPGLLCASVGVGLGLKALAADRTWGVAATATLLLLGLSWQLDLARHDASTVREARAAVSAGLANMHQISGGAACYYESNTSAASFYLGSPCEGSRTVDAERSMQRMEARTDTFHSFLVWRGPIELRDGWTVVETGTEARWRLYHYTRAPVD